MLSKDIANMVIGCLEGLMSAETRIGVKVTDERFYSDAVFTRTGYFDDDDHILDLDEHGDPIVDDDYDGETFAFYTLEDGAMVKDHEYRGKPCKGGYYSVFLWRNFVEQVVYYGLGRAAQPMTYSLTKTKSYSIEVRDELGDMHSLSSFLGKKFGSVLLTKSAGFKDRFSVAMDRIARMIADGAATDPNKITITIHRGDDLANAYSGGCWGHHSCMVGRANVHKIRVYQINPQVVGLANIERCGASIGRCLIWGTEDGPKFYDRIYAQGGSEHSAAVTRALEAAGYRPATHSKLAVVMKLPMAGMNIPYFDHMATGARIGEDRMVVISRSGGDEFAKTIAKKYNISQWGEFRNQHGVLGMLVHTIGGHERPVSQVRQFADCDGNIVYAELEEIEKLRKDNRIVQMWSLGGNELYITDEFLPKLYQHPCGQWMVWLADDLEFLYINGQFLYKNPDGSKTVLIADTLSRGGLRIPIRKARGGGDYPVYSTTPANENSVPIGYMPKSTVNSMRLPTQLLGGLHYILVGDGDWDDAAARDARHIPAEVIVG